MSAATEKAVSQALAAKGVAYNVTARGPMVRDKWECDGWDCRFANELGHVESFEYYTGIGHRQYPNICYTAISIIGANSHETANRHYQIL